MHSRRAFLKSAFAIGASGLWLPKAQVAVFRRKPEAAAPAGCTTAQDSQTGTTENEGFLGYGTSYIYYAGSFSAGTGYTACKVAMAMRKTGSPTFDIRAAIYTDSSGSPGSIAGTPSDAYSAALLDGTETAHTLVNLGGTVSVGTNWLVFYASAAGNSTNYVRLAYTNTTGVTKYDNDGTGPWSGLDGTSKWKFTLYS